MEELTAFELVLSELPVFELVLSESRVELDFDLGTTFSSNIASATDLQAG